MEVARFERRHLAMNGKRRLMGSFWHGSMANAMPQAIGAQTTFPDRQVVSLSGDGGFAMLMGDLISVVQLRLPVKVVAFNNGALGFIELEQKSTGFLDFGTDLANPNFAAMAETIGIRGIRLEDAEEVTDGSAAAFAFDGPVLIDAVVNRTELAMPPADYRRDGQGLPALHGQGGDERPDRRDCRPRQDKSLALRRFAMELTALLLSRLQFAFTVSFHIIFPSFTIGLAAWLTGARGTAPGDRTADLSHRCSTSG